MAAKTIGKAPYRRFLTISNQLAALGAIGVSIGFVVVIWVQTNQARSLLYDAERHHNIRMAELVAAQLYAPLRNREAEAVRKAYAPIVADGRREALAAVTLDRDGNLLAAYQKNAAGPAGRRDRFVAEAVEFHAGGARTAIRGGRLVVATPVLSGDGLDRAGTFVVAWSLAATDRATQAMFMRAASITLVVLAVFVTLSLTIVHRRLSDPLADIPPRLLMDARRMDQVFTNLLSNAVKYALNAPNIDVKAGTVGDSIVVSVRDFGLGIPKDELPKLFEKFFRASTSTGIPGTGIGLHLVKHLVGLHQGSISVDSIEG